MSLATLAEFKRYLGITVTTDDPLIQELLDSATEAITTISGRGSLEQTTFTEFLDGEGLRFFHVKNPPINSITSIHDDPNLQYGSDTLIQPDDFEFDAEEGRIVIVFQTLTRSIRNIRIIYSGGYPAASIPADLRQATKSLAAAWFNLKESEGLNKERIGAYSADYEFWPPGALRVAKNYRRLVAI